MADAATTADVTRTDAGTDHSFILLQMRFGAIG
jgi:hypothetical protein